MSDQAPVRQYNKLSLIRDGRLLTITMNRAELMNAVNLEMLQELADVFTYAAQDMDSDVVVLTGAGRAFSAGGDLEHIEGNAANPENFEYEARLAKQIVFSMLDMEKPLICRMNGHAVGLGATLALMCDVIFAADTAKIGDPHVALGLVAGDGGAAIWPQRIGFGRAKEFLMTGDLLTAAKAEEIGLINHCVAAENLDAEVSAFCDRMLNGATKAIRWTKVLINQELKRIVHNVLDTGLAYEGLSAHSADHREGVRALQEKRKPVFGQKPEPKSGL
ncbi:enoyl-CoA hydratase/isomerase family protein [Ketobacter sp. MCCC 1A13808]|uniref:enoyl-CoA hydratase/isomerase family protein n=1 Tax=Ketobacter sp. MCCC 1A13808 TaxID=2602738 RepID=UPI000F0EA716|nr:enoyl-CoA hydratase/isomerase family protein [Ketobacter sp. MCCC 1A13808]MVF13450.1 enoyl-CoA hydratase/isomerase family protein [Ketobacter sp. MCCC 1A13808]RLP52968.1 MAG: enoyl-CoA hydratase/isomerase family protein [Ketobacter sp.]